MHSPILLKSGPPGKKNCPIIPSCINFPPVVEGQKAKV
jgi:hypothetical protein